MSLEKRKEIINDLRFKKWYNKGISKNNKSFKNLQQNNSKTVTNDNDKKNT